MTQMLVLVGSDMEDTYYSYTTRGDLVKEWVEGEDLTPSDELVAQVISDSGLGGSPCTETDVREALNFEDPYKQMLGDLGGNEDSSEMLKRQARMMVASAEDRMNAVAALLPSAGWDAQEFAEFTRNQAATPEIWEYRIT